MEDCEDEDIVLHQSPLDQYLEEVTDQAFGKYVPHPTPHIFNNEPLNVMDTGRWCKKNLITTLKKYIPERSVDTFHAIQSCHVLLKSPFLCDEDQNLLIDLYEEVQNTVEPNECSSNHQSVFVNKSITYINIIIVLMFSIFISMVLKFRCWYYALTSTFILLLISGLVYPKVRSIIENVPKDIYSNVQQFVDVFHTYDKIIDKVIRHIKEVEVITHGYSQINMFYSLQQKCLSKGERCLKLRSCLMCGLSDLFNQLRNKVQIILDSKRNGMQFDYKEEYIAMLPIDTFSEVLYSTSNNNQNGVRVTPLDQLKAIVCLYRVQMSEYIYIMIVSLFTFHHNKIKIDVKEVLFSLKDLNKNILNILKLLEEQLNISVKLIFQKEKNICKQKPCEVPTMEDVLHSSEIHLHTALARIEELKIMFQQNSPDSEEFPSDILQSLTSQFNLSLENAKFCIEDIVDKVQQNMIQDVVKHTEQIDTITEKEENYVLFTNKSIDIGDMLYEGESDSVVRRESGMMNIDDIGETLKESKESRKLMRELKTILSVKESPVGLISFPLMKINDNQQNDIEYSNIEHINNEVKDKKERRIYNSDHVYNPGDDDSGPNCPDIETPKMQQMSLPIGFLPNLSMERKMEVIFGSSTDDEEDCSDIS